MHVYVRRIILDLHHEWSFNKPFASYGVEGITILNLVGLQTSLLQIVNDTMHREHPAKWCTDCNWTSPIIIRTITNFASETIWFTAGMMKSANCISAIGRIPYIRTNCYPSNCRFCKRCIKRTIFTKSIIQTVCRFKHATFLPTSSPKTNTFSSRSISSRIANVIASI